MKKISIKVIISLIILLIVAIILRVISLEFQSIDYKIFLSNWWKTIENAGVNESLKMNIGNYNSFYMYILMIGTIITKNSLIYIKIVSILFDIIFAFFVYLISKKLGKGLEKSLIFAVCSLLLPTIILNGSVWGQCDIIYGSMIIGMIYFCLSEKYEIALLCFGIAFASKLQAIFITPLILYLLLHKKIKIYDLFLCVLPFLALGLPNLIAGKSVFDTYGIYLSQAESYSYYTLNTANFYQILNLNFVGINTNILPIISIIGMFILAIIIIARNKYNEKTIITISMLCVLFIPYFLPKMHERYLFLADIMAYIYFICFGFKRFFVPALIGATSVISYLPFLISKDGINVGDNAKNFWILGLINLIVLIIVLYDFSVQIKEKEEESSVIA